MSRLRKTSSFPRPRLGDVWRCWESVRDIRKYSRWPTPVKRDGVVFCRDELFELLHFHLAVQRQRVGVHPSRLMLVEPTCSKLATSGCRSGLGFLEATFQDLLSSIQAFSCCAPSITHHTLFQFLLSPPGPALALPCAVRCVSLARLRKVYSFNTLFFHSFLTYVSFGLRAVLMTSHPPSKPPEPTHLLSFLLAIHLLHSFHPGARSPSFQSFSVSSLRWKQVAIQSVRRALPWPVLLDDQPSPRAYISSRNTRFLPTRPANCCRRCCLIFS